MNLRAEDPKLVNNIYQYAGKSRQNSITEENKAQPALGKENGQPYATPEINSHVVEALNKSNKTHNEEDVEAKNYHRRAKHNELIVIDSMT